MKRKIGPLRFLWILLLTSILVLASIAFGATARAHTCQQGSFVPPYPVHWQPEASPKIKAKGLPGARAKSPNRSLTAAQYMVSPNVAS